MKTQMQQPHLPVRNPQTLDRNKQPIMRQIDEKSRMANHILAFRKIFSIFITKYYTNIADHIN